MQHMNSCDSANDSNITPSRIPIYLRRSKAKSATLLQQQAPIRALTDHTSWKVNHKLHAIVINLPCGTAGRAAAAAVKASGVPKAVDMAESQQAEHNSAVREDEEALPCEAAITGTQHGGPAVSSSSDRLAHSSVSTSAQPRFDSSKADNGVKVLTAASPQTAIHSLNKQQAAPSGTHAALPASPEKHSAAALAKPPSTSAGTLTPADVKGKPGLEPAETLLMVHRLPAVLSGSLPTAESLGMKLSMPSTTDVLRKSTCLCESASLLHATDPAGWSLSYACMLWAVCCNSSQTRHGSNTCAFAMCLCTRCILGLGCC